MAADAKAYMRNMREAVGTLLIEPGSLYSGREGHERFARECGYALRDFSEDGQKEILSGSYSTVYVSGCRLKPILDAKEWISIMEAAYSKLGGGSYGRC